MSDKNVLVLTGYTDTIREKDSTDSYMKEVFDVTLPSKMKYATHNNYDFMAIRNFRTDPRGMFPDNKIGQLRFIRTIEMLHFYDAVMWIDADSIITNNSYKLEDFMDSSTTFVASYDWMITAATQSRYHSFSTGNFIVQKTPELHSLIQLFYTYGPKFGSEQEVLNFMYLNSLHKGMKSLEHRFLNSAPSNQMLGNIWPKDRPSILGHWTDKSFLVHLTGLSNSDRLKVAKEHFGNFL